MKPVAVAEGIYIVITSSQADQVSLESSRLTHGLFAYFLMKGLSGEADRLSEKVRGELDKYVASRWLVRN